jgi:hypothetical protein
VATTTGPDLTGARAAVERLMDDTCTISSDPEYTADDTLDEETGELLRPAPDAATVYDGPCLVSAERITPSSSAEGGTTIETRVYHGLLPWNAPVPVVGSLLTVTSSRRDPELVGKVFIVRGVAFKTKLVSRRLALELR